MQLNISTQKLSDGNHINIDQLLCKYSKKMNSLMKKKEPGRSIIFYSIKMRGSLTIVVVVVRSKYNIVTVNRHSKPRTFFIRLVPTHRFMQRTNFVRASIPYI